MRTSPLVIAIPLSFAAGFGAARGWKSGPPPSDEQAHRTIAAAAGEAIPSRPADSPQTKADAQELNADPIAFLTSLQGQSSLTIRSRVTAAIARMSLDDVRRLAEKAESLSFGNSRAWEMANAAYERWAELDSDDLLAKAKETGNTRSTGWAGVSAAFRQLTLRNPEQAWSRAGDLGPLTYAAKSSVIATLGESDPARALALTLKDGGSRENSWMAGSVMAGWMVRDRDAALAACAALPADEFRADITRQMAGAFATIDPDAAIAWGRTLGNPAEQQAVIGPAFGRIAIDDPQRALAMAERPEFAAHRRMAIEAAVGAWARRDFNAAFDYAMNARRPADQQAMLHALNANASLPERERLLSAASQFAPAVARDIYLSAIGGYFGNHLDPDKILATIDSPSIREDVMKAILNNSWSVSTDEARKFFGRLQPTSQTTAQASEIAQRLAYADPASALEWAESLASADLRKAATTAALQARAWSDPAAAAQHAATLTEPAQREEALRAVAQSWGPRDEEAALAWAQTLAGTDRSAALGALVQNAGQSSPEQAVKLYATFAASLDAESAAKAENRNVARSLAQTLTENDPQRAIAWAQTLAGGPEQHEAFAGIAGKWAGYDARAASEWIAGLPEGEGRDLAADSLVTTIARDDPESAWAWALSIADPAKRREAAARSLDAWKAYGEKQTALDALQSGGFTPDEIRELSKKLE